MAILGTLLKRGIRLRKSIEQENKSAFDLQRKELKDLLFLARNTQFGKKFNFKEILAAYSESDPKKIYKLFQQNIPIFQYNKMYEEWWSKCLNGEKNVCWPGAVRYFALSSGTSDSSSKHIPVTGEMIRAIRRTSMRQILSLSSYKNLPAKVFEKGILMLGGSTHLNYNGNYFEGDLSGITAGQLPFWFQHFYKPGKKIAGKRDWEEKLDEITEAAHKWDIGIIVGVPAWIQILLEKIIERHNVKHIHEIWPNLEIYVHGGVFFEPYKKGFEKLLGHKIQYIETYLASEGFIAFQANQDRNSMRLVVNNGLFYEFIPFDSENFDETGQVIDNPKTLMIDEIEENKDYALLLNTCAGSWRYMIGDVIRFVSKQESEIIITGRTKHFLSLCGEHMSVDNMNTAVQYVSEAFNADIREFTVAGVPHEGLFAHKWFIGTDDNLDPEKVKLKLDESLKELNDDYCVERSAALKDLFVHVLPVSLFYDWLKEKGKEGGQNKFPRVLKEEQLEDWTQFVSGALNQKL